MPDINLNAKDYLAITKALDTNRNNRIDPSEATISQKNGVIGNGNNINGVKELADSLEKGDVVITGVSQASATKIADYFSTKSVNQNQPVEKWKGDGWISKADLTFSDKARKAIDINNDNRISSREFADALRSGGISIGNNVSEQDNVTNDDPFSSGKPIPVNVKPPVNSDPFSTNKPVSKPNNNSTSDPFGSNSPNKPVTSNPFGNSNPVNAKPPANSDPFSSGKNSSNGSVTSNPFN